ncbi:PAS domain S-box protein [Candidatus Parabeggiatoa sp. HSG14]|uniref:PAS domain S-box protein n=1 Tax=Candidatus Parabeggiatoa sp. HSG14 TaxID=3055593 RepID=UPI0025A91252|nr:PAS domain S-box protein [Thiotrichales bacterium HSG14]
MSNNTKLIKILYIEDDVVTAARVQMQLDLLGYVVDLAKNGEEGIAKLQDTIYDIVAIDYHLPGSMNGLQVLQNLAENQFNIPAIMITGAGNERIAVEAMKLGAGDYVIKDLDNHYLKLLPSVIECELEKQQLIIEKQQAENALYERDTILEAVSFAAEKFLTCTHWTQCIQEILARLGQAVTASRVYIFENHPQKIRHPIIKHIRKNLLTSLRYEWIADNILPQINNAQFQNVSYYPHFKHHAKILAQGQPIYGLMKDLPTHENKRLAVKDVLSFAIIPIFVEQKWWGFIGYDDCIKERKWSPIIIEAFKMAANLLGAAIQHEQMNDALRKSEARLAEAQHIAHLGHCEWDLLTNTRQLSEEALHILGLPPNNHVISNKTFLNAIHLEDRNRVQKAVKQTIRFNKPYDVEFRITRPDGTIRYLHALSKLTRDANSKPIRFIGTAQDITDYKHVEKALRESTQSLSAILNAATDSIAMIELDTTCVTINPAGAKRLGLTVEEVINQRLCELVPPDVSAKRKVIVEQMVRTLQPCRFEDEERKGLWFEHSMYPVCNESGSVTRLAIVSRDITERKQAEEALKKERDFTNAIINTAGNLIVVLDRMGHIIRFNKTSEELTGYTFEEVKGQYLWNFFLSPEKVKSCQDYFYHLNAKSDHSTLQYETCWITKDKTHRFIDWSHTVLLNDNGQVKYFIGCGVDITERKQAEEALGRTLAELEIILDNSSVGIAFINEERQFVRVNSKLKEICGYTEEELKHHTTQILYSSHKDYKDIEEENYPLIKKGKSYEMEHLMRRKDGTQFWSCIKVKAIDSNDISKGFIWNLDDITERKLTEERLRLAATVFETITEGILVSDADSHIIMVNPAFTAITGYTNNEVIGKKPSILSSGHHNAKFYEKMWKDLVENGKWQGEIWNRRKNSDVYVEWLSIAAIRDSNNKIVQYVAIFNDITKRKQIEELIWHQANYDALTNLPNRILFADRLEQSVQTAKRHRNQLGVMFIDLDHFKWVNDTLGHKAGDQLLKEAAQRLTDCVRDSDMVARLGGDEFTAILNNLENFSDIKIIAGRILQSLSNPFMLNKREACIAASIGIAFYPEDGQDAETLLKNADIAMYQAKKSGRNAYRFFMPEMNIHIDKHLQQEKALRYALENNEFTVYYQPVIDISSKKIVGTEALLRWQKPNGEKILPSQFIASAEETGLIIPIGQWCLETAANQLKKWHETGLTFLRMAINVSACQLQSSLILETLKEVLRNTELPADALILELTEDILLKNLPEIVTTLHKVSTLGVKIAINDFGSGYASMHYLKQFPIDILKINPSFINQVTTDNYNAILAEAIIALAHKLDIKVVGVGVETEEQLTFLHTHHCDLVQGRHFSDPLTASDFERLFEKY